ncbi:Uncharacterized protein TPAR_07320 [Tolypocladium paradoxum]|uniref:Uncharacterized protein n=1 Tax=Tolypocladium paradoxum TaxID=94208 RepID=A0A2S4KQL7_9HYPO|nr:Uncharacterized protein TPAR_07320 [Tolypocladium paradoxum]
MASPTEPASRTSASTTATRLRQVIAPLTTTFHVPPLCSACTFVGAATDPAAKTYSEICAMYNVEGGCPSQTPLMCFPHVTEYQDIAGPGYFYSPGIACPSGWWTAATVTSGQGGGSAMFSGVMMDTFLPGETAAICCPMYLTYHPSNQTIVAGSCSKDIVTNPATYKSCSASTKLVEMTRTNIGQSVTISYKQASKMKTTTMNFTSVVAVGPTIQINYRAQDLTSSSSTSMTSGSQTSGAQDGQSPSNDGSPLSLRGSTIAGVVVGAVCFLVGVGLAATWVWRRQRRSKAETEKQPLSDDINAYNKPELEATVNPNGGFVKPELEATARFELDAASSRRRHELDGDGTMRREIDGNSRSELPGDGDVGQRG